MISLSPSCITSISCIDVIHFHCKGVCSSLKAPSLRAPSLKAPSLRAPSLKAPSPKAPSLKVKAPSLEVKAPSLEVKVKASSCHVSLDEIVSRLSITLRKLRTRFFSHRLRQEYSEIRHEI